MNSLGTRLALLMSAVLFMLMLVAGFWIQKQLVNTIYQEEIDQAEVHAKTLLASLQTLMLNGQGTLARQWLDRMGKAEGIADIKIYRRDGNEAFTDLSTVNAVNEFLSIPIFERTPSPLQQIQIADADFFQQALRGNTSFNLGDNDEITVLMPIKADTACLSCHGYESASLRGVLKLSISTETRAARITQLQRNLWIIAFVLVSILGSALFFIFRWSVLDPLSELFTAISSVAEGDREVLLLVDRKDELGRLAARFNEMQKHIRQSEVRVSAVMDSVLEGILIMDEQGKIESVNPAALQTFGYQYEELFGASIEVLMPEPYAAHHEKPVNAYVNEGEPKIIGLPARELEGLKKDGTIFPIELSVSEMLLDDGRYFVGVIRDITERKRQMAIMEHAALHDSLTGLPNRTLLTDRLKQTVLLAQRSGEQFSLLLMDLDHFKEINDTLGHHYGDVVLQQVAVRMRETLRESDTIARLGGDEFAVLLPSSDIEHAEKVAKKMLFSLENAFLIDDQLLHVGGSIGAALYPEHAKDEMTLLRMADVAMYVAKRAAQGFSIYDPAKDEHKPSSLALLGDLREAIEQNQLVLYFQPKVSLQSGRLMGVEALVRWQHPKRGLMLPDSFIPFAEQSGLILPLTLWVLKRALMQLSTWYEAGIHVDMAINLSVRNLQDSDFPRRVSNIVSNLGRAECKLWFEITETAIMADPARAEGVLVHLNDMNIDLSIDDFGTGYSSLAYLKQLPVKEIKIDKGFVMGMFSNDNDAVIVRSIIDLAHNIGLQVIAEGVENKESYDRLAELGCDLVQGYFISRPLPVDEFDKWLAESQWR
ncbi:MAG: EAL domain-containing protein [Gammaproteobacteria bacterium]|nr:EAL domain-containing protein [Gammaproteobacteria bacterium]